MSDLKNGDIVELTSGLVNNIYHGDRLKFVCSDGDNALLSQTIIVPKYIFKKVEEFKTDYETSNRKKLHDYIKASRYTSVALGEALGNTWYFSNITKPSRMKRGDISSEDLLYFIGMVDLVVLNKECRLKIDNLKNNPDCVEYPAHKVESKKSNWMTLNKIAFAICFTIVILLISILYFVVSK